MQISFYLAMLETQKDRDSTRLIKAIPINFVS